MGKDAGVAWGEVQGAKGSKGRVCAAMHMHHVYAVGRAQETGQVASDHHKFKGRRLRHAVAGLGAPDRRHLPS